MIKRVLFSLATGSLVLYAILGCTNPQSTLRSSLVKSWQDYRAACASGDASGLEKTMSAFRFGTLKNNLADANRSMTPEFIMGIAANAPDLSQEGFVTMLQNGPTAGLVYSLPSGPPDASGKEALRFLFVKFVDEGSGWKVDGVTQIGGSNAGDGGAKTGFDPAVLPLTYEIDGKVRPAPQPVEPPYASAMLDVFSGGYRTRVTVNGVEQAVVADRSFSGLVKGGLRKGGNRVVVSFEKTVSETAFVPSVKIRRVIGDRESKVVFQFEKQTQIEGSHELSFTID